MDRLSLDGRNANHAMIRTTLSELMRDFPDEMRDGIVEHSRAYLAKISTSGNPPEYKWFGCDSDSELHSEIQRIADGENLEIADQRQLERTLDIMYFG